MNTESNLGSFADMPQPEFFQKFLQGQNLVDSSASFARLNSKTVTERSIRESFMDDYQNYEIILQQVMASNLRLMDEISKTQKLEARVQQLERENSQLLVEIKQLKETNLKCAQENEQMKKLNQQLKEEMAREGKKLYMHVPHSRQNGVAEINKIIMNKTESSFQFYRDHLLSSKFTSPNSKIHNSNPFIFTTRPQSPSTSLRQSTPTKTENKLLMFNNTTNSWRDNQSNRNAYEFKKFKVTMEQLMKKPKKVQK